MSKTIEATGTLHVVDCPSCGCTYAIPDGVERTARKEARNGRVYCPNGHTWHYPGKTHAQIEQELRDRLAAANARRDQAETDAHMAKMREEKERKAKERLQKRASAGTCPHCNRTFQQLARHMKSKHAECLA